MTETGVIAELDLAVYQLLIVPPGLSADEVGAQLNRAAGEIVASLGRLGELSLVRKSAEGVFLAVSPALAESQALGVEELEINTRRIALENKRNAIRGVTPQWAAATRNVVAATGVEVLHDSDAIMNVLMHYAETCRDLTLSVNPGRRHGSNHRATQATIMSLRRGVQMRELFQHVALRDRPTYAFIREMADNGAQIRFANTLPGRSLVVDGEIALLPVPHFELRTALAVVREPSIVTWVISAFEQMWEDATPLDEILGSQRTVPDVDQTRAAILRLMGEGEKDEAISRKLSISVRTCRRHIADYMAQVGATSRFQAGVIAAREGHLGHD
jgi:DNA-binding CsgD family transcriptional regulator